MIQEEWQKRMEAYLGCKLDITWTRTPAVDYADNELVVLQSGQVQDVPALPRVRLSMSTERTAHC